jgi:hypothetical protein
VGRLHVNCIHVYGMGRVGATKASRKELPGVPLVRMLARICLCFLSATSHKLRNAFYDISVGHYT